MRKNGASFVFGSVLIGFCLFLLSVFVKPSQAQTAETGEELFSLDSTISSDPVAAPTDGTSQLAGIQSDPTVKEVRLSKIKTDVLNNDQIVLNFPDGKRLTGKRDKAENLPGGYTLWQGKTQDGTGAVNFITKDGGVAGSIKVLGSNYKIETLKENKEVVAITLLDESKFPPDESPEDYKLMEAQSSSGSTWSTGNPYGGSSLSDDSGSSLAGGSSVAADSSSVYRVLVGYTPAVASRYADVGAQIWLAASEANQAYANSGINIQLQIADFMYVNFKESSSMSGDRDKLAARTDGVMDEVHTVRNNTAADVVVLLTQSPGYSGCGIAKQIRATATSAFAIVQANCATGNYTFAHEIGHLQGARHNTDIDSSTTPFAYGHGFCKGSTWRTIMAYGCPKGDGQRINYFSNPSITFNGLATGNTTTANNARVLNETAYAVANFRVTPVAPAVDQNYYTYHAPQGMQGSDLAGYDLWNIPEQNAVQFTAGIDIDADNKDELAVMKNQGGDWNLYVYKAPKCAQPASVVAKDLWAIPAGNNIVAMAGGNFDGDGKKNDIAVIKNEGGDWNLYVYRVNPGDVEGTLIATDLWTVPEGNNVVAMAGVNADGAGRDELAIIRNQGGDYNYYAYKIVLGQNPATLVATDLWNIPEGSNTVAMAGGNFDLNNAGDEIAVIKNEGGDQNLYVYDAPWGTEAAPKLGGDLWNIPVGSNVKVMNAVDAIVGGVAKSHIGVIRNETTKPSLPVCR